MVKYYHHVDVIYKNCFLYLRRDVEFTYKNCFLYLHRDVDVLLTDNIMGFILNTPTDYKFGFVKLPIHRKHWIAIRWLHGQYMNLDSKLDAPVAIGDQASLLQYLRSELSDREKELLLVVEKSVYDSSSWRRGSSCFMVEESKTSRTLQEPCENQVSSKNMMDRTSDSKTGTENGIMVHSDFNSPNVRSENLDPT